MTELTKEQQIKKRFAYEWLKNPRNAYVAALRVTHGDTFAALTLSTEFVKDPEVVLFKEELEEEYGEDYFLPSRAQLVRMTINRAEDTRCDDDFCKLTKLAADMMGYIEKPGVTINNNTQNNLSVMRVPMPALNNDGTVNEEDWENRAIGQQRKTIKGQLV